MCIYIYIIIYILYMIYIYIYILCMYIYIMYVCVYIYIMYMYIYYVCVYIYIYILCICIYTYIYIHREREPTTIWVCLPIWDFPSVMALFGVPDCLLGCSWKDNGMTSSRLNSMVVLQGHWACNVFF